MLLAPEPLSRLVRWRYHFTDFRTGTLLATLPMTDVSLSDVLAGPAAGGGTVPLSEQVLRRDPFSATVPRRSCMWAERQELDPVSGQLVDSLVPWAGIVMTRERAHAARTMKLGLVTFPSYWQRRLVGTASFRQADKFTVMRWLIGKGARQDSLTSAAYPPMPPPLAPLDPDLGGSLSGVLADRTYLASDLKPALEAATELSNSGAGFDWRLVPRMAVPGDLTSFEVLLELGYPRLGRVEPADLRWSTDRADSRQRWGFISDLALTEDGSSVANRVTAMGAGTGEDQIRATADSTETSRDEDAAGFPLYEGSVGSSSSEDRTYDTVRGKALGALLAGFASEIRVGGIKVRGDLAPTLPSYSLGDDLTLRIGEGTTGQPLTIVGQLVGRTIEPGEQGRTEMVTLDVQGAVVA